MKVLLNTSLRFFAKSNFPTTVEPLPMPPPFHSPHTCPHTWVLLHQSIHVEKRYSFDQFIVLNAVNYCLTGTSLVQTPWKKITVYIMESWALSLGPIGHFYWSCSCYTWNAKGADIFQHSDSDNKYLFCFLSCYI